MTPVNIASSAPASDLPPTHERLRAGGYENAFSRAMAFAPILRAERIIFTSLPPTETLSLRHRLARPAAAVLVVAAAAAGTLLVMPGSTAAALLGTAFGIAAAATGDRLGAALRRLRDRRDWQNRIARLSAAAMRAAEAMLVVVSAFLVARSAAAGLGLGALTAAALAAGYATRVNEAQNQVRAAAHAEGRRKLRQVNEAFDGAVAALRDAHADDIERIVAAAEPAPVDKGLPEPAAEPVLEAAA